MTRAIPVQLLLFAIATTTFAWTLYQAHGATAHVSETEPQRFEILLRVTTEEGVPLADASTLIDQHEVGKTNERGTVDLQLVRSEGSILELHVGCPPGYVENSTTIRIVLQTLMDLDDRGPRRRFERPALCKLLEHTALLVVTAPGAAFSPIVIDGKIAGATDVSGSARLTYRLKPNVQLTVTIDTSTQPDLKPKNPVRTFTMTDADALFVFEQSFERQERVVSHVQRTSKHQAPYRLN